MTTDMPRRWLMASRLRLLLVAGVLTAHGMPAAAQNNLSTNQPKPAPGVRGSQRGYLSLVARRNPVLGEKFAIDIKLPASFPEDGQPSLEWALATGPGSGWSDSTLRDFAAASPPNVPTLPVARRVHRDSLLAPYLRPGQYELKLLHSGQVLDVLPVRVDTGRVRGAISVKRVHRPGARIDLTVNVPGNRYYYGQWHGPVITLVPDSVGGRRIPTAEAQRWWSRGGPNCGGSTYIPCTMLLKEFASKPGSNPYDGGVSIQDGTYTVNERFVTEKKLQHALFAPMEPGIYKVRFYDRFFAWEPETYFDLFIDEQEIVVEAPGVSPSVLQFVAKCAADLKDDAALKKLTLGVPSFLAAVFDVIPGVEEPAERSAMLERVDLGKVVRSPTKLTRVAPGVYCSGPIVPFSPAEPRRPAGRTS